MLDLTANQNEFITYPNLLNKVSKLFSLTLHLLYISTLNSIQVENTVRIAVRQMTRKFVLYHLSNNNIQDYYSKFQI